ncbi:stage II sporulation protein M [Paenibacillus larvae]|uniref:stage II sporulation protein M n=1 Tax=Paenibacillus larvae TaxID=1464 RepID=UPI00227E35B8|nr:stage II sporulation protein M [Paenibacillus larvae]MCY9508714.1 stage II sporulation protein M [Paenibacillus larvae]MCY9525238.1 stage II sporulation protein M [Paenibacillus larvae]
MYASIILFVIMAFGIFIGTELNIPYNYEESPINGIKGSIIFIKHNIPFIIISISGIFLYGIPSILILLWNGFFFGAAIGISLSNGMNILEVLLRLSHGIFEVPALLISSAVGFLGFHFYQLKNKNEMLILACKFSVISVFFLIAAAVFEANLTDYIVNTYTNKP